MNEAAFNQVPPNVDGLELAALGAILIDPRRLDDLGFLRAEHFRADRHRRVYAAFRAMHDAGEAIDIKLLAERLKRSGDFEAAGGSSGIFEAITATPVASHAVYYAKQIVRAAELRDLARIGYSLYQDAQAASGDPADVLTRAETALARIGTSEHAGGPVDLADALVDAMHQADELQAERPNRIETGLADFDRLYGGFFPNALIILGARPGGGKSALAGQIALHNAGRGRLVYYASLEMGREELATRFLCGTASVNNRDIRNGRLTAEDRSRMVAESQALGRARLKIDDRPSMTVADIRRTARKLARDGLRLAVVDYLQLITPADKRAPREQQVAQTTRELKAMARELRIPVLVLSQLNRLAEDERPRLSHLRESGAIEQDADMVCFLYDHEPSDAPREDHNAVLEVAKHRHGERKTLRLYWDGAATRFSCPAVPLRIVEEFSRFSGSGF